MNSKIKTTLIALCASLTLLPSFSVLAHEGKQYNGPWSKIGLSEEQKTQLSALAPAGRGLHRYRNMNPFKLFGPVVLRSQLDPVQLDLMVDAAIAKRKALGLVAAERRFSVKKILTELQQAKLQAERKQKWGTRWQKKWGNKQASSLESRLSKKLSLSDEQREQMRASFDQLGQSRAQIKAERKAFKSFEEGLFEQDTFDSKAWLAQFETSAVATRDNLIRLATHANKIYTLLDRKQQMKLKRHMRKVRGKGERQ